MRIWVDADACPKPIKEILFRAAIRTETQLILVANHALTTPPSPFIKRLQVSSGFDVADNEIVKNLQAGDLVITADLPLANAAIEKDCLALNPRGKLYTKDNIKPYLTMRNFNEELRGGGINTGGPDKLRARDNHTFATQLDKLLHR